LAYFAGVLDGEGCFTIHQQGRGHIAGTAIHVGNTDLRMLQWIQERFGGNVAFERRQNPAHAKVWRWTSHVGNLEAIIIAVLPYLVIKREQAELLLAYRKTLAPPISGHRSAGIISDDVKSERQRILSAIGVLNKRGA
jgi:hypothetical protein